MKPPRLPSEFVDAVRQELGEMPQQERRSMRPSEAARRAHPPFRRRMCLPRRARAVTHTAAPRPIVDPELTHAFEEAVELLIHERQRVFEQTASQLAELAAVIARRVIAREISLHPELVCDLVREGTGSARQARPRRDSPGPGVRSAARDARATAAGSRRPRRSARRAAASRARLLGRNGAGSSRRVGGNRGW